MKSSMIELHSEELGLFRKTGRTRRVLHNRVGGSSGLDLKVCLLEQKSKFHFVFCQVINILAREG